MNELLAKLSSYNIFNYLVPGALFGIAAKRLGVVDLTDPDLATNLLTFYILGMIVSRLGSLGLEPALKKIRMIEYAPYSEYIRASQKDVKIEVLIEVSNTHRTLASAFLCLLAGYTLKSLSDTPNGPTHGPTLLALAALAGIFLASYRKQSRYVRMRINALQMDRVE